MIAVRKANDRGRTKIGWLDSYHTFSFGRFHDPEFTSFRALRVINDDVVAPGMGFDTHPHKDMEIITYVLDGGVEHKDSTGGGGVIRPGDVQRMSAGTGVYHSEFNASKSEPVHLLQIWILPDRAGHEPRYDDTHFSERERTNTLRVVASADGRDGSLTINQDASVYASLLDQDASVELPIADRFAWVQLAKGRITVNGQALEPGDGAAVSDEDRLTITANEASELLVFDLA